jgi:hypothetical protein
MTSNTPYRVTALELLILQQKVANQAGDPQDSPVYQLRSLLGV